MVDVYGFEDVRLYYDGGWTKNKTNLFEKSIIRFNSRGNPIVIFKYNK